MLLFAAFLSVYVHATIATVRCTLTCRRWKPFNVRFLYFRLRRWLNISITATANRRICCWARTKVSLAPFLCQQNILIMLRMEIAFFHCWRCAVWRVRFHSLERLELIWVENRKIAENGRGISKYPPECNPIWVNRNRKTRIAVCLHSFADDKRPSDDIWMEIETIFSLINTSFHFFSLSLCSVALRGLHSSDARKVFHRMESDLHFTHHWLQTEASGETRRKKIETRFLLRINLHLPRKSEKL